jgi:hypothetical protein
MLCIDSQYSVIRHDRLERKGGGVAIFYKNFLKIHNIQFVKEWSAIEALVCDIKFTTAETSRFILCYRPPNYNLEDSFMLCQLLQTFSRVPGSCNIIGDFNLPELNFDSLNIPGNAIDALFYESLHDSGFNQLVFEPTRNDNVLDLIFSSDIMFIHNIVIDTPFCNSDHATITFTLNISGNYAEPLQNDFNFRKADYNMLEALLSSIDWPIEFSACVTVDDFYKVFIRILTSLINCHVPKFQRNKKPLPGHIKKMYAQKRKVWKNYKKTRTQEILTNYKTLCNSIKISILENSEREEDNLISSNSMKNFYNFVNKRLKSRRKIPSLVDKNKLVSSENDEKSNKFNQYFASVFTNDDGINPHFEIRENSTIFSNVKFDMITVLNALNKLKPTFSVGPDGLCAYFLKKLRYVLAEPIRTIFEISFRTSKIPEIWSSANVIPIFKKGDPSSPENYRPVSLCCVPCKVMECIINEKLTAYLDQHKLLSCKQYGFRKNKSCALQILKCKNYWSKQIDIGESLDVVYIDFSKAFDTVSHKKLVLKLASYGINGLVLSWIKCFLTNRVQRVRVENCLSMPMKVSSGVPQGSVLGPTFFLLYINDLLDVITDSEITLFADDVKIFNQSKNFDELQTDLNNVSVWAKKWQLKIATDKCVLLHLGHKNPKFVYKLDEIYLSTAIDYVRDLGVYISNDLSNSAHVNFIKNQATKVSGLIFRSFTSRNTELLVKAFKTYVRPILEYSSTAWNPHLLNDINSLESVQRKFTKRLFDDKTISYENRLNLLGLERLELRRIHFDLIMAYNILIKNYENTTEIFTLNRSNTRAKNSCKLQQNFSRLNCRKYDFSNRIILPWNSLSDDLILSANSDQFKTKLKRVNLSSFIRGRL